MILLQPEEYDASYFDGSDQALKHNAGYSSYKRWYRKDGENSTGEFWKDYAVELNINGRFIGKKLLDIGCAKGFLVEDLRELGVDAYGMDVSSYAIGESAVQPYLTVGDARTDLAQYKRNEFDFIISTRVLECFSEAELPDIISEMNRISRKQVHVIDDENLNENFYLKKSLTWWKSLGFQKGTILISQQSKNILIK